MIAVTGATGQLGTAFAALLPEARLLTRRDLDLSDLTADALDAALEGVDVLVNCAAYTAVDAAEEAEGSRTAIDVNALGPARLATEASSRGTRLVTYSTDYVFPGTGTRPYVESDPTDPVNSYGRSKVLGERAVLATGGSELVIRTSWVISGTHPNFVATMLRLAREGRTVTVVDDQRGCPTVVDDLARATLEALDRGMSGLLHLTNEGETTWFELARTAVAEAGLDPELIQPCTTAEYPTPARRPAYSVLGSERDRPELPHWRDSLPALVRSQLAR